MRFPEGLRDLVGTRLGAAISAGGDDHDEHTVARILADSGCHLGDDEACLDALVEAKVYPWQFKGNWLQAKIEANNLRAARYWMRRSLGSAASALLALVIIAVSASPSEAAGMPLWLLESVERSLWIFVAGCAAVLLLMGICSAGDIARSRKEREDSRQ